MKDCDAMSKKELRNAIAKSAAAQNYMDQSHIARPKKRTLCAALKHAECVEKKLKKNCFRGGKPKPKPKQKPKKK